MRQYADPTQVWSLWADGPSANTRCPVAPLCSDHMHGEVGYTAGSWTKAWEH